MTTVELIAELRGFAEGSESARATLMRDAADELERLTREMHARELHHFETEMLLTEAGIDPDAPTESGSGLDLQSDAPTASAPTDDAWEAFEDWNGTTGHFRGSEQEVAFEAYAAGFRRQEPITDESVRASLRSFYSGALWAGGWTANEEKRMRAALEAARDA